MTDRFQPNDRPAPRQPADDLVDLTDEELSTDELQAITGLLDQPALWAQPSPGLEDAILADLGIGPGAVDGPEPSVEDASVAPTPLHPDGPSADLRHSGTTTGGTQAGSAPVVSLDEARRSRGRLPLAAAAAVVVAALASVAVVRFATAESPVAEVALAGTEEMPGASATVEVIERDNGALIRFEATGLAPAPEGMFYAAWLIRPEPRSRISAGTFHMRGGDGTIDLWTGVWDPTYTLATVTLQLQDDPEAPGPVVLRGELDQSG